MLAPTATAVTILTITSELLLSHLLSSGGFAAGYLFGKDSPHNVQSTRRTRQPPINSNAILY